MTTPKPQPTPYRPYQSSGIDWPTAIEIGLVK